MRSIFEISTRGMLSARTATEVTSNNIANANNPGFTRRAAVTAENVQQTANGTRGLGVNVTSINRLRNELADQQINRKEHEIGELSEKESIYRLMETALVSTGASSLDSVIGEFFNAFSELSTNPQDLNLRNVLVSKTELMTESFRSTDIDLAKFSDQVFEQANNKLNKVNTILQDIAALNEKLAGAGGSDNNALDQQTRNLNELAKLVEFDTANSGNGAVEIRIGGIAVVNGNSASEIRSDTDPVNQIFRLRLGNGKLIEPAGGELSANIFMFEEGIQEARDELNSIATSLIDRVNDVHSSGFGMFDNVQRNFFSPDSNGAFSMKISDVLKQNPGHIAISSVEGEAGNNDKALEMVSLQNERFLDGETIGSKTIQFMGLAGSKINEIEVKLEAGNQAKEFLVERQQQTAGVSIDEELSNLIRFQNSFQASARVLDTGRTMFDTLLSIT